MIRLFSGGELFPGCAPDVYTEMVRSLYSAYGTKYDFCRFYKQDGGAVLSYYYGSGTAACTGELSDENARELSEFLRCGMLKKVLMPYDTAGRLGLPKNTSELHLMRFSNGIKITDNIDKDAVSSQNSLGEIYEIISDGFDIDRDTWYTDTSHMLRRGTAETYRLGSDCAAVKMFSSRGISYLSYVCTRKSARGKGLAKKLVGFICMSEARKGNDVFLFCGSELKNFYESIGFSEAGMAAEIQI